MSGEEIYRQYQQQVRKEHPPDGTIDSLRTVVSMIQQYAIPELPANENGQIPFMRAIFESVIEEIEASICRQETDRETATANEKYIAAIPALCRGEEVTCALHVSQPIKELVERLKAAEKRASKASWITEDDGDE